MIRRKFNSIGGMLLPALLCLACIGMSKGACGPPPLFYDKTHGHTRASYQAGDTVQYSCFQGYSYSSGSRISVCREDGTWLPVTLECQLAACSNPGSPINGYRVGDDFTVATRVAYHCYKGYLLQGESVSTCLADLTWSQHLPTCTVVTCPTLEAPANGHVLVSSNVYGSRAIFTCDTGFVYSEDFEYRDCQEDGSWSELEGNCTAIDCGEPWINNGTYRLSGGTGYADAADFTCNQGTMRFGSKEGTLSYCNKKQLWQPPPPICWGEGGGPTWRCPSANLLPFTSSIAAHPYNNKCYQFVHVERYWTQARDYCRRYGGRLLTIPDAATNAFILRNLNNLPWENRGVWIGLHDRADEMVWEWSTESDGFGQRVTWTNWGRGHPRASFHHHRDCVRMVRGSGTWRWHETPCALFNWKYRYICQYEMMPSTAAIVATSPSTTRMTSSTKLPTTTTTKGTPSTTFRYGVGGDGGPNVLGKEALKETKSLSSTAESATTEERDPIDVHIPLQLQQNDNDGHTNVLGGVVVACLIMVVLSLLVITVVYFRRRRQKKALASSLNLTNPSYCSAACGSIVAANGQTTLLKLKATQDNEYTDEPLGKGGKCFIPPYRDDVTMSLDDEYQEVKVADDICPSVVADQNKANREAEKKMNNNGDNHVYADPYDVPRKRGPIVQLRPRMPAPGVHYIPMDGGNVQKAVGEAKPRPASELYLTPVSSDGERQSNIYAEIPGDDDEDTYPLTDNVYETLDDLDKKRHLTP